MDRTPHSKSFKDKTLSYTLLLIGCLFTPHVATNPHRVYNITWKIANLGTGEIANLSTYIGTLHDGFPPLYVDLCDLVGSDWDPSDQEPFPGYGCHHPGGRIGTRSKDFYVCPGHKPTHGCGGPQEGYCARWGCETTGEAYWKPSSSWDFITLKRREIPGYAGKGPWRCGQRACGPCYDSAGGGGFQGATPGGKCNPLILRFTDAGKRTTWDSPKVWGLRLHRAGKDPVTLFSLYRQITPLSQQSVGPNIVIADQRSPTHFQVPKPPTVPKAITPTPGAVTFSPTPDALNIEITRDPPGTRDRLLQLIQGVYQALNFSDPNKTQECWLCLVSRPPYYEGVAILGNYSNQTSAPTSCGAAMQHKLTISEVSGKGLCIGRIPSSHQELCNQVEPLSQDSRYLVAPYGTYWACSTGLTPCVSTTVLNTTIDFCILIELWPKVTYHQPEYVYSVLEKSTRYKREPISFTVALLLGGITMGGIAAGIGTGTVALQGINHFKLLQQAMHTDIQVLEESVSALEKSLTSLSEVVLQNRRGLDLLFLQEGGLCAALKEECCFYADHTGIVRDSMAKLRERLKQRQQLFESQQGWFEGWFAKSPWLTTLISTLMGPLVILFLILIFGPCILNKLTQFIRERLSVVQALVLTQQYHQLKQIDPEYLETSE
ncbi:MLV-related proviral Env polyprotein-like [Cricetulus griseus]|uniref:Env n=1 Tax=Cricetulus griseus TaxID=10029 RepID=A0A7T1TE30_CRIGR|nr:MLV-related proviral Env polyprotein-like [Cricetulus griseus]XP_027259240.1 MLV-related proviral Env polyprotein-like [Cricetulus griseus]XP_027265410.1 MLV-related proviral Env polyprotein-like [Cricetulus griseus]XP_035296974.1 MLV-related proviral Env polyprotein-like [Cricetulus griseus]XP_035303137.1 MLV-related proviral Env polyprotein-like [Cricetulus griseus]XP_035308052.1 MLV-related proviral Env polyprotein-like [Cricetulus griseus]XP_035308070.1 MLV-related proviral Env polypro